MLTNAILLLGMSLTVDGGQIRFKFPNDYVRKNVKTNNK